MPKKHLTNIIAHNPEIQHIKGPDLNTMYFNMLLNSLILHLFTNSNPFIIYLRPYEYGMILKSVNPMRMKTNYIPFDSNTSHWTFEVARDFVFVISNEYNAVAARGKIQFSDSLSRCAQSGMDWDSLMSITFWFCFWLESAVTGSMLFSGFPVKLEKDRWIPLWLQIIELIVQYNIKVVYKGRIPSNNEWKLVE